MLGGGVARSPQMIARVAAGIVRSNRGFDRNSVRWTEPSTTYPSAYMRLHAYVCMRIPVRIANSSMPCRVAVDDSVIAHGAESVLGSQHVSNHGNGNYPQTAR